MLALCAGSISTLVFLSSVTDAGRAHAQVRGAGSTDPTRAIRAEITPAVRLSVSRGLAYLVRKQTRTGGFRKSDTSYPVADNALLGLALLAGGYTDTTGPREYVNALKMCTQRVLSYQTPTGYFFDDRSRMYGHGFATLFLAELYGTSVTQDKRIRVALKRAVKLIEKAQGTTGGWDYYPEGLPGALSRFGGGDTSITVCQTLGLRAARNLGIKIDSGVITKAKRYIWNAQKPDGGFAYRFGAKVKDFSDLPRSAAGTCVLYSLGEYMHNSSRMRNAVKYLRNNYRRRSDFPHYAHYYCAQAMFQVGGRYWREYFAYISKELLDTQRADGSWKPGTLETSTVRTAMSVIVLQLPFRFLPIHER